MALGHSHIILCIQCAEVRIKQYIIESLFDCFVTCSLHSLPVCCRFIHFCVTVRLVLAVHQLHNLNKCMLCIAETTYLQYRPQWDLLQEPSRDGSAVG